MIRLRRLHGFGVCLVGFLLAACAQETGGQAYFQAQEDALRARGLFKVDRIAENAPYTADDLVENFRQIAFGSEYALDGRNYVALDVDEAAPLRRWAEPVHYTLAGRPSPRDHAQMARFAQRISQITGLAMGETPEGAEPNVVIHFLSAADRAERATGFDGPWRDSPERELFLAWADTPTWPCAAELYDRDTGAGAHQISYAVVYIRNELSGLYRQSCIEEEVTQMLGLGRDHPRARPSIFNDDEEFVLLTRHDEDLLRILYNPLLRPGMTARDAMPVVEGIARSLRASSDLEGG